MPWGPRPQTGLSSFHSPHFCECELDASPPSGPDPATSICQEPGGLGLSGEQGPNRLPES